MSRKGLTLIEVAVAIALLSLVLLSLLGLELAAVQSAKSARWQREVQALAQNFLEGLTPGSVPGLCPSEGSVVRLGPKVSATCRSVRCALGEDGTPVCGTGAGTAFLVELAYPAEAPKARMRKLVGP